MELLSLHATHGPENALLRKRLRRASCCLTAGRFLKKCRPQRIILPRVYGERPSDVAKLERLRVPRQSPAPSVRHRPSPREAHNEINQSLLQKVKEVTLPSSEHEEWKPTPWTLVSPRRSSNGCPVFVMLPLDTVWVKTNGDRSTSFLKKEKALKLALNTFKQAGVEGVMVDIWWGIVERDGPKEYDFSAYKRLCQCVSDAGLKIQAVLSFHSAGSNVGDTCKIPLPQWLLDIGEENPDIFYTDKQGYRNRECLSLGCDHQSIFHGRTAVQMYKDYATAFLNEFRGWIGTVITEITVGLGPAGELRYPSYPEGDGRWRFPGVGEFQCYDKYMLQSLKEAAEKVNRPEWGHGGPHDAGNYNAHAWETGFFHQKGSFQSEYGHFFLSWYSEMLIKHAESVLTAVSDVLGRAGERRASKSIQQPFEGCWMYEFEPACHLGMKLAGVHWWFNTNSHAAELTAGYYNAENRNGYEKIVERLKHLQIHLSFTCVEMRDCDHPPEAACSPQGLLAQVIETCQKHNVRLAGENALQRYDTYAFGRILENAFGKNRKSGALDQITFLRMADSMFDNWGVFQAFLDQMNNVC